MHGIRTELVDGSTGERGTGAVERWIKRVTGRRESTPGLAEKQRVEFGGFDDHWYRVTNKLEGKNKRVPREPRIVRTPEVDARKEGNGARIKTEAELMALAAMRKDIGRYNGF